jgi:hypothetical protein
MTNPILMALCPESFQATSSGLSAQEKMRRKEKAKAKMRERERREKETRTR